MSAIPHIQLDANNVASRRWDGPSKACNGAVRGRLHENQIGRPLVRMLAVIMLMLVGMVLALDVAAASASPRISLDVLSGPSTGSDGYTDTTASNGDAYHYKYSGGEGNGGDLTFKTRGRVTINVHLTNGSGYTIDDVAFTHDSKHQLSWPNKNAKKVAVIRNDNSKVQTAHYKITVRDEAKKVTVPCDPRIINR